MLFDLKEAGAITRIYEKFSNIGNEALSGYAHVRGKEAAAEVDDRLLDRTLDRDLYEKVSSVEAAVLGHYPKIDIIDSSRSSVSITYVAAM